MQPERRSMWAACLLWWCGLCGCHSGAPAPVPGVQRAELSRSIRARSLREFPSGDYFKPSPAGAPEDVRAMAPLIIQELRSAEDAAAWFGGVVAVESGVPTIDPSLPVVYYASTSTVLAGVVHEQLAFVWFYRPRHGALSVQGIRMTLASDDRPLLWEALADPRNVNVVFVSEGYENQAHVKLGGALPGRRFAVERDLGSTPFTVVARVLADGAAAMGPWVYLGSGDHHVSTLLCRCMPAQVQSFAAQPYYDLLPISELRALDVHPDRLIEQLMPAGVKPGFRLMPSAEDDLADKLRFPVS